MLLILILSYIAIAANMASKPAQSRSGTKPNVQHSMHTWRGPNENAGIMIEGHGLFPTSLIEKLTKYADLQAGTGL